MGLGFVIMCFALIETGQTAVSFAQKKFFEDLTKDYDPSFRPVLYSSTNTTVSIRMGLKAIITLDEKKETLSCNGFFGLGWKDELLRWNYTSPYDMVLGLEAYQLWTPNIVLLNSVSNEVELISDSQSVTILFDGTVTTGSVRRLDTICKVNIQKFPFDRQDCYIQVGAQHPYNWEVLEVLDTEVNLDLYEENGEFDIIESNVRPSVLIYEGFDIDLVVVKLTLKRRATFYILNTILPVVFLSFLNTLVFLLPEESGEKVSLSVSLLLSYAVFLTLINSYLPENSDHVCFFSVYLAMLVIISTLISVTAILIMALHSRLQKGSSHTRLLKFLKSASEQNRVKAFNSETEVLSAVDRCNNSAFTLFFVLTVLTNFVFFVSSLA